MKTLHSILTVIFYISMVLALVQFVKGLSYLPSGSSNRPIPVIGTLFAVSIIPIIIFIVRYVVGKNLKK